MKKLVLIDGHSLAFRAFYALPLTLKTDSGKFTNAVYGFTSMFRKVLEDLDPDYIAVAFDKGPKTFRNEIYEEYKGTRSKMPEELREQIGYIEEVLSGYNVKQIAIDSYEADDIIGTVAKKAEEEGSYKTYIITGDRDLFQLADKNTSVLYTKKGITNMEMMDVEGIDKKYGVKPKQLIDVKALMGDSSDNIPGISGVGEKTALKLVKEFDNLDGVLNNIDKIGGKVLPRRLEENKDIARLSYDLAKIRLDIPIEIEWNELLKENPNYDKLLKVFDEMQFNTFAKNLREENPTYKEIDLIECKEIKDFEEANELITKIRDKKQFFFLIIESDLYLTLGESGQIYKLIKETYSDDKFARILSDKNIKKITHRVKQILHYVKYLSIELKGVIFDTALAAYVLEPTVNSYNIAYLIKKYDLAGSKSGLDALNDSYEHQIMSLPKLYNLMSKKIEKYEMRKLYHEVEIPLANVLFQMEHCGIAIDKVILENIGKELVSELNQIEEKIFESAGEAFNINSPKQLSKILFDKLGLPVIKKTKTGYSTAHDVLLTLSKDHELPAMIIHYRQLAKLNSTYIEGLIPLIEDDGRIRTTYKQTTTATGRLSSTEPNLQNIPIRMEQGRKIRKAFVPGEDFDYLLSADYSQIELRILAHLSQDKLLIEAFKNDEDIHTRTAAEVFGVAKSEVSKELRSRAKAVNFGIVYGQSDYGLSQELDISRKEAGEYIDRYFDRYKKVRDFLDKTIVKAKSDGYVETMLNRRRYLPEINSRSYHRRSFAERTATNTPIQGSAADLIKLAMVKLSEKLEEGNYKSRMLLQVHDELVLEVKNDELEEVAKLLEKTMVESMDLTVPIKVDLKLGKDWYDMERYDA
ncbi:MAG: DNA polymerase I [Clostridia bacterium]